MVSVGPPLFCSPLVSSNGRTLSPMVSPLSPVLLPKPHEPSSEILKPPLPMTPVPTTPQLVPVLPARIEFTTCTVVSVARIAAPALELPLLLLANVLLVTVPP
jgi:hypothetical protein